MVRRLPPLVAGLLLLVPAPAAAATTSNPADGAALADAPASVTLTFGREPVVKGSHVTVLAADGRPVTGSTRPARTGRSLTQPVGIHRAGDFTIVYRVAFAGGGQEQGSRRFRVAADPHAGHTGHGVDPVGATLLVIDGLVAAGVLLLLMFRRPGGRPVAWRLPLSERKRP